MPKRKNLFFSLIILLLFVSCEKNERPTEVAAVTEDTIDGCAEDDSLADSLSETLLPLMALPARELSIKVNAANFTAAQNVKIKAAASLLEKVVNSYEFREKVLDFQYLGQSQFASTNLSNNNVYQKIMTGKEQLSLVEDKTLNLELRPYYTWRSVVAYTTPQSTQVNFNTKYLNYYTAADIAKTIMHEWLHKIGFNHDYNVTSRRPYSVPYGIGEIVKTLARTL